ncbi:general odorant-binding protein 28a-like [Aricia agestis]|uniref:general odorant-binding protein 28a-like n=1 Tax=Aricia agestis TaxID=91739 RepID=UPI001C207167|nr:general odorant-binding protein 28a-like [Aricia agestis]
MFEEHIKKCAADLKVDEADLSGLHKLEVPTKTEVKCVLACAYKTIGTMNDEGKYDIKKGYEFAKVMEDGDPKRLENGKKVADICSAVNDEPVTDGEKGCDRAALMFKCMLEHAPKYGFKLE